MSDTSRLQEREEFWTSDEYLKRNATGAHANSKVIISELEEVKSELREMNAKLDKFDRYFWALGFGILIVMFLAST